MYDYLGIPSIQTSYKTTFDSIVSLMRPFGDVLSAHGITYDTVGATTEIIKADLVQIPITSKDLFNTLVDSALDYWNSDAGECYHFHIQRPTRDDAKHSKPVSVRLQYSALQSWQTHCRFRNLDAERL